MFNFIVLLLPFQLLTLLHPFNVSITDVNYNSKSSQIEMISRIFYDDLEVALKGEGSEKIELIKPKNRALTDSLVGQYLQKHLKVAVDGKIIVTQFVGYQIEEDVAACYLIAATPAPAKSIEFKNDLLYQNFDKQSNILHIKIGTLKKSTKLDNPQSLFKIML